ncbi:dickkopf-related protein 3a isoform X2 [Channa argus]|uniref:dickkopf-related protein 3a isoform X2 n=1 Tax=Channa argus TaxID=215402 RepID=UPI00351FE33F
MMRVALLVLAVTGTSDAILPETGNNGISHILEDNSAYGQTELDRMFVEVEQLQEDPQPKPEDAFHQKNNSVGANPPPSHRSDTASDKVIESEFETNNISTTTVQHSDQGNNIDHIDHGCITKEDCGKGRYCLYDIHNPKCLPCKAIDVTCTKDEECCGEQLCVWGQCSQNATKGEPGTTCQYQTDCNSELCCALHKALLFPVCLAKPIERERCFGASNHLMELLSWDVQNKGPRKHCPCAGNTHCQHLGRGSMCLKGKDSSEEELTDTLYSEIDYII